MLGVVVYDNFNKIFQGTHNHLRPWRYYKEEQALNWAEWRNEVSEFEG